MEKGPNNLNTLLRSVSENQVEIPSKSVIRKLRFRLWIDDFFSVRPNKFNILYAGIIATVLIALPFLTREETIETLGKTHHDFASGKPDAVEETEKIISVEEESPEIVEGKIAFPAPEAIFSPDIVSGCSPLEVHFTNKSKHAKTYSWDFGNGTTSSLSNPSAVFKKPGAYEVKLTVVNETGVKDVQFKNVLVREKPTAAVEVDIATSNISDREIHFNNLSRGAHEYTWEFGDNDGGSGEIVRHVYKDYGIYKVKLIAYAGEGCSDTAVFVNRFIEKNYELAFPLNFRPHPTNGGSNGYFETAGREASVFYPRNYGAKNYHLSVFAVNGMEVFSTKNIKQGWNGYIRGRLAPGGTYYYKARGVYPNGKEFKIEGDVQLLVEDYYSN